MAEYIRSFIFAQTIRRVLAARSMFALFAMQLCFLLPLESAEKVKQFSDHFPPPEEQVKK